MGKIILYAIDQSPPARTVLLTLKALNIPYEFKYINLAKRQHESPEYRRINPRGTVPALDDDGHIITESHAISAYLVSKYGKDDTLYPKDLVKRSIVDEILYYDTGAVFDRVIRVIARPLFVENRTEIPQSEIDGVAAVYEAVNDILKDKPYAAGDHLTIADFALISSISSLQAFLISDDVKYPHLAAWIKRLEQLPYYEEANGIGVKSFIETIHSKGIKIIPKL